MPAFEEPIFTEEHTFSVTLRASGIDSIRILSPFVYPLCTRAEKPPIKFTPTVSAALSKVLAYST